MKFDPNGGGKELLPEGEYRFECRGAEEAVSKSGNDMIVLRLTVFGSTGEEHSLKDWITAAFPPKIKAFCEAAGLSQQFETGQLSAELAVGATGKLRIIHEEFDGKMRAKVDGYTGQLLEAVGGKKTQQVLANDITADDIPF